MWAKHLFNQIQDPEAAGDAAGENAADESAANADGNVERKSTRSWAQECGYSTQKLFQKFFNDDIKYLLSMEKLCARRMKPTPLDWDCLPSTPSMTAEGEQSNLVDQKVWSVAECANQLDTAINILKGKLAKLEGDKAFLVWDKDDIESLNFVTACANIRMHILSIKQSMFEVKSKAGNIIPAIATTNAVIAGCIVMEAIKILNGQEDICKTVYLRSQPNPRKKILVTEAPNPKCYVCAEKPEVNVRLNKETFTIEMFQERILKGALNMVAPDAEIEGDTKVYTSYFILNIDFQGRESFSSPARQGRLIAIMTSS